MFCLGTHFSQVVHCDHFTLKNSLDFTHFMDSILAQAANFVYLQ